MNTASNTQSAKGARLSWRTVVLSKWGFLALLAGVILISRIATLFFPFDSDHWIFYYIGSEWFHGSTLYVDMWDHKAPLVFAFNGFLSLFGDSIVVHRIVLLLVSLVSVFVFYKATQTLFAALKLQRQEFWARVSTLLFACIANLSQFTNSGNNTENLGILVLGVFVWLYLRARGEAKSSRHSMLLIGSGLALGLLFYLKANFVILALPVAVDVILLYRKDIGRLVRTAALLLVGPALLTLIFVAYFASQGTLHEFLVASLIFNGQYMRAMGWDIHARGLVAFLGIIATLALLVAYPVIKSFGKQWRAKSELPYFLPMLSVSAGVYSLALSTFYSYYYLMAIPYACMIIGAMLASGLPRKALRRYGILVALVVLVMMGISLKQLYNSYQGDAPGELHRQQAVARYIDDHTQPDEKIFSLMYGATMYRLAERDSGTRFISASHPLIDYKYKFGYDFNGILMKDLETSKATYVIESAEPDDLYLVQDPVLKDYFAREYHEETVIDGFRVLRRNT